MATGTLGLPHRRREGALDVPTERIDPCSEISSRNSGNVRPLAQRVALAVMRIHALLQPWRVSRLFWRPSARCSVAVLRMCQAVCVGYNMRALASNARDRTFVVLLLLDGAPRHIAGFVVAFVIKAIDRVGGTRLRTYVGKKYEEVIQPFLAHGDTPSSVVRIASRFSVVAAPFYLEPRSIFRRLTQSVMLSHSPMLLTGGVPSLPEL